MRAGLLATIAVLHLVSPLQAQHATKTRSLIRSRVEYRLPPSDSLTEQQQRELSWYSSPAEYDSIRGDSGFALEKIRYLSSGLEVVAYVYRPRGTPRDRAPAIIYNRGSYVAGDLAPALAPLFHRLATAGLVVVAPQYRGSDGGQGTDELGGADVEDVMNAVSLAASLPAVDSSRLFMYGESRGGMMTFQALRRGAPIRAAATVGAFTDLAGMLAANPEAGKMAPQIWPDFESRREEIVAVRSALRWADELRAPLLLMHGGADRQISPAQSLALAMRLQELGRPYELHILAGGSHSLGQRSRERDSLVVAWFLKQEAP